MVDTAKEFIFGRAPRRLFLHGDPVKALESAEHILVFPGGSISTCRTASGEYWAHVEVNREDGTADAGTRASKRGRVVSSRMDFAIAERDEERRLAEAASVWLDGAVSSFGGIRPPPVRQVAPKHRVSPGGAHTGDAVSPGPSAPRDSDRDDAAGWEQGRWLTSGRMSWLRRRPPLGSCPGSRATRLTLT